MLQESLNIRMYGIASALGAAISWAYTSILYRKLCNNLSPIALNLLKCIIGSFIIGIVIIFTGLKLVDFNSYFFIAISSILGISIGDTLFFKTLVCLGPRLTLIFSTLIHVFTIIFAVIFLNENISIVSFSGILLTLLGVTWVLIESLPNEKKHEIKKRGIVYGILSMLCMSFGVIFAKVGVKNLPALDATFIRIVFGVIGLGLWTLFNKNLQDGFLSVKKNHLSFSLIFTVSIGLLGSFLFLLSLKHIDASIANTLNATAPLFVLPFCSALLGEKITTRAVFGTIIAVCGVVLILNPF